ncbi:hypothetical protein BS78_03G150000 [Paspalum vaginatum]|nr:hypothetical protein BS78_06G079700 [Paspalum vaginatum]KAJ1283746.1 hypothetical protein BS78_03G150000 [Paspalum vaginatum]
MGPQPLHARPLQKAIQFVSQTDARCPSPPWWGPDGGSRGLSRMRCRLVGRVWHGRPAAGRWLRRAARRDRQQPATGRRGSSGGCVVRRGGAGDGLARGTAAPPQSHGAMEVFSLARFSRAERRGQVGNGEEGILFGAQLFGCASPQRQEKKSNC